MKKLGLTLVAALAFSVSVFAQENADATPQKWDGTINKAKLSKYLQLNTGQHEEVADICDFFQDEMKRANRSKNSEEKVRNAVYGNLKLMKKTLDDKQYASYVRLMAMTLRNKGIDIEKK
ncbi:hypothetical protein [uncultured Phocaeicola sp.]|jgi:hypothetical protein|uniref:hypothetical protein n=1 Tax=uncultured Phocaeicola sp. TaxID=990718 RepID=UPI0015A9A916|nr:hypothetical protein [uncultured Phocaeicola sp.]